MLLHQGSLGEMTFFGRIRNTFQLQRRVSLSVFRSRFEVSAFLKEGHVESPTLLIRRPYQLKQAQYISMGRRMMAEKETPVKSPLSEVPQAPETAADGAQASQRPAKPRPKIVKAMLRDIPQSPIKMNLVAKVVRGMRVNDALIQMSVLVKRAAATVFKVLHSARANASHNYGFDPEKLIVAEAFVGKGTYIKHIWPHAKGRFGIRERKRCRLTVYLREMTPKEESMLEMLKKRQKEGKYIYRTKLLPHKIIETRWSNARKNRWETPDNGFEGGASTY